MGPRPFHQVIPRRGAAASDDDSIVLALYHQLTGRPEMTQEFHRSTPPDPSSHGSRRRHSDESRPSGAGSLVGPTDEARNILTVGLEDYFEVAAFRGLIQRHHWYRFERSVERGTRNTLEFLDRHQVRATFFVMGWVAEELPELVRDVAEAGHEIATKGYYHKNVRRTPPEEFREDLLRSREALERAAGSRVLGYRAGDAWLAKQDLWALDILAQEGFEYDSSLGLVGRRFASEPWRRFVHTHTFGDRTLTVFPISSTRILGQDIPIAGGNYFRQFPPFLVRRAVSRWIRSYSAPFVMYFHTWEMDEDQPRIGGASMVQKVRHYRNLARMSEFVGHFLDRYRFTSVAEHQGFSTSFRGERPKVERPPAPEPRLPVQLNVQRDDQVPVTIIVPCYNEEVVIPYLNNTLERVRRSLEDFDLRFVFVDDASTDRTWESLNETFGHRADCVLIRQEQNGGPARAILSGLRASTTEIVCSIDCDCSYDPHLLATMIPLLEDDVDLVTASPYHPEGGVANVPRWRLFLSRGCSGLYRLALGEDIHTFTACFRVYRRSTVERVRVERAGFLGIAELIGKLSLTGGVVREQPAVLEARVMGRSSMKIAKTIAGHLGLLSSLMWLRVRGKGGLQALPPSAERPATAATASPPRERADTGVGVE